MLMEGKVLRKASLTHRGKGCCRELIDGEGVQSWYYPWWFTRHGAKNSSPMMFFRVEDVELPLKWWKSRNHRFILISSMERELLNTGISSFDILLNSWMILMGCYLRIDGIENTSTVLSFSPSRWRFFDVSVLWVIRVPCTASKLPMAMNQVDCVLLAAGTFAGPRYSTMFYPAKS